MKKTLFILSLICVFTNATSQNTEVTQELYDKLLNIKGEGIFFGMHDATGYGVGWNNDNNRSNTMAIY